jgi:hypothetical protein
MPEPMKLRGIIIIGPLFLGAFTAFIIPGKATMSAPGNSEYKFIVDGKWILDPDNKLYEENQYGTGNSVLCINSNKSPQVIQK